MLVHPEIVVAEQVSIPSNGSSLFQYMATKKYGELAIRRLNPLKRVKFISMDLTPLGWVQVTHIVSIPSNGSSLFQ